MDLATLPAVSPFYLLLPGAKVFLGGRGRGDPLQSQKSQFQTEKPVIDQNEQGGVPTLPSFPPGIFWNFQSLSPAMPLRHQQNSLNYRAGFTLLNMGQHKGNPLAEAGGHHDRWSQARGVSLKFTS